jgi:hypothetical protein
MSKKRQRMQSFREAEKRILRTPPKPWSLKDKLVVFGSLGSALLVFTVTPFLSMNVRHRSAIDRRLNDWKHEYGLTESEVLRLREIEISFHRLNLLGAPKQLTSEQLAQHNQHLADQMNDKSARKFIDNQQMRKRDH